MHLARSTIFDLAPARFDNQRKQRYRGDDQAVRLATFSEEEQKTLLALYAFLGELVAAAVSVDRLDTFLAKVSLAPLAERIQTIGFGRALPADVASAAHDLRSGMLSALFLELAFEPVERIPFDHIRALARDCAKLMRNLVAEIGPHQREEDLRQRVHSMTELVAALRNLRGPGEGERVTLASFADEQTAVASCCAEFGTIERIVFILLGNAARHAGIAEVEVTLAALEGDLRVVVANALDEASRASVEALLTRDPTVLYSQFSTTGSGLGLQTVADLVGRAYGVHSTAELVTRGYVGTKISSNAFVSWFHWPLAAHDDVSRTARR